MLLKKLPTLWFFLAASTVWAQTAPPDIDGEKLQTLRVLDQEVTDLTKQLGDWDEQYQIMESVINNLWTQNNWNSEADLYARNAALKVSKIPPWDFQGRMEAFDGIVKSRYNLTDRQLKQMQQMLYKEMFTMTMKYGPIGFRQAQEAINTRLDGRPFTPEQVSRWIKEFDPMLGDYLKDIERLTKNFGDIMTDEQREIYKRDLESMHRRIDMYLEVREEWMQGKWKPSDWGLQDDPIHQQTAQTSTRPAFDPLMRSGIKPYNHSSWARYVIAFIKYYRLDSAQQKACITILEDMVSRARRYHAAHKDEIEKIPTAERTTHHLLAPICEMFEELKSRLEVIPTDDQRQKANQRSLPPPKSDEAT